MDLLHFLQWIEPHIFLVMVALFLLLAVTTYWPGRKQQIERQGQIPFQDDR